MKPIFVYDSETTGLPDWNNPSEGEQQPHLVQLAALLVDPVERKVIQTLDVIIKPDGWVIPEEVASVHGITTEYAMEHGVPEKLALEMLLEMWGGRLRIGHNESFDSRIIRIATKRYSDEATAERWKAGEKECTGLMAKPIMQLPPKGRYGWKMPKLSEAYEHFMGVPLQDAHSAMADAYACMAVWFAIQDQRAQAA